MRIFSGFDMTNMRKSVVKRLKKFEQKLQKLPGMAAYLSAGAWRPGIPPPKMVPHSKWVDYLSDNFNKPGFRILEIGSRNVTGVNFRTRFDKANYTGFDFYSGENVDVV